MPFDQGTITCRACLLPQPLPADAVARFAAKAAGPLESVKDEIQVGWVSARHLLERRIDEETAYLGGSLHLCLRQAQRKVPAALLKAECRMAELAWMLENQSSVINRKERKRIKEETSQRLLPQMPPQLTGIYFAVDAAASRLYVSASSEGQLETFIGFFGDTVGVEPIPLGPDLAARELYHVNPESVPPLNFSPELPDANAAGTPGQNFLTWVWFLQEESGGVLKTKAGEMSFMIDGPLNFVAEGPGALESSIRKGIPTLSAEAKAALTVGKKLKRAKFILARDQAESWATTVDADSFLFRGLKLPDGEALEAHAAFQERMNHLHLFQQFFYALYERFLKEMKDSAKFGETQRRAKEWVRSREAK
jgi:hypothetical protein